MRACELCVNSGKRALYLNQNPWRVLMQGQEREWMNGEGATRGWSGWVLASRQGKQRMPGSDYKLRKRMSTLA